MDSKAINHMVKLLFTKNYILLNKSMEKKDLSVLESIIKRRNKPYETSYTFQLYSYYGIQFYWNRNIIT